MVRKKGSIFRGILLSAAKTFAFQKSARTATANNQYVDKRMHAVLQVDRGGSTDDSSTLQFTLDSGANVHACNDASLFTEFYKQRRRTPVTVASGHVCEIESCGSIKIVLPDGKGDFESVVIKNVNYMPTLDVNILSIRQLWKANGITVRFRDAAVITFPSGLRFSLPCLAGNYVARLAKEDSPTHTDHTVADVHT